MRMILHFLVFIFWWLAGMLFAFAFSLTVDYVTGEVATIHEVIISILVLNIILVPSVIVLWIAGKMLHKKKIHGSAVGILYVNSIIFFLFALIMLSSEFLAFFSVSLIFATLGFKNYIKNRNARINATVTTSLASNIKVDESAPPSNHLLVQGYHYVQRLSNLRNIIQDVKINSQIEHMLTISKQIFDYATNNPSEINKLERFINYYFPTALTLLENYASFSQKSVKSSNIKEVLEKISASIANIEEAFEHQLDNLYHEKVLDVNADIAVLERIMREEGIGFDNPLK